MKLSAFFLKHAIKGAYKLPFFELARHQPRCISWIPFHPIRAAINVTHNCNSKCITCSMWQEKSRDELTIAELSDILSQLRAMNITDLSLTGGEPLLRSDLATIVSKARELEFARIHVVTNGLLLTQSRAEELIESGAASFYISLNGTEEAHDMTRGIKGAYAKTVAAIETLVKLRDTKFPHLEIGIEVIVMGQTLDQVIEVANMCRRWKAGLALAPLDTAVALHQVVSSDLEIIDQQKLNQVIAELHKMKRSFPSVLRDSQASLEYVRNCFADRKRESIPCYLGYLAVYIAAHGEVSPACYVLPPVGNLREAPLKQIFESRAYKERLRDMILKRCPGCACDYILNLYAHVPFLLEEIAWKLRLKKEESS